MVFIRPLPPGTKVRPVVPDLIFIPIGRAFERLGVYFYNQVLSRTDIGLYDKRWNPRIHGPYCHWRYYGPPDTKLMDVKLSDLPAWFSRRDKSIRAMVNEFHRNVCRVHYLYYSGPVYGNFFKQLFRYIFAVIFINWLIRIPEHKATRSTLYHW